MRRAAAETIRTLLEEAVARFEAAGIAYGHGTTNALDEAAWLVLHGAGLPPRDLDAHLDRALDAAHAAAVRALVARRIRTRQPAAYLLHEAWLGPHRFHVDERVIVPRSFIAEFLNARIRDPGRAAPSAAPSAAARGAARGRHRDPFPIAPRAVLDLCTGSGCLAILAALAFPDARVDAADLSEAALAVARRNVDDYGLGARVRLVRSDLFGALGRRRYDLIVSNPPYVSAAAMRRLPPEYRREPALALASGADGLEHTRRILAAAPAHLAPAGLLMVEIGHNRKALEKAYPRLAFAWPRTSAGAGYVFTIGRAALEAAARARGGNARERVLSFLPASLARQQTVPKGRSRMPNSLENAAPDAPGADPALVREIAEMIVSALNLELPAADIDPAAPLYKEGLGLDSIDILEVALVVSKRYGFKLRDDDQDNQRIFRSLDALAAHVAERRTK